MRRGRRPATPVASGPADPNAPYIFRALASPAQAQVVVTIDELYRLSRML
jgi:hypothetical protein